MSKAGSIVLTKQGDKRLVELGDTLLYTITVRLLEGDPAAQATVRDRLPAGFIGRGSGIFIDP